MVGFVLERIAMAKRTRFEKADCPIARAADVFGDCWSMLIIRDAMMGLRRFSEFQKNLGVAKNILTVRLRALVTNGMLKTEPASDGSAYEEYVLTPKGRAVFPVIVAMRQWSEEFAFAPGELPTIMVDRSTGQRVRKLELHAQDGTLLGFGDTKLKAAASAG
jgi:DNA-binding HxlR family transcriptional regulator